MTRPLSDGQRLIADAKRAAEVRNYQTDPDVVALQVERVRRFGERFIWSSIGILLVFAMITVQIFVARGAAVGSLPWLGAWFLEPGIVIGLIGILIWESVTTRWLPAGEAVGPWARTAKWGLLAATYTMNTWNSWAAADFYGVAAHSVPPLAVFCLTEARSEILSKLERCVIRAHDYAVKRNAERAKAEAERKAKEAAEREAERTRLAAEQAAQTVPAEQTGPVQPAIGPPAGPSFQAVPGSYADRSRQVAQTGPDRSADRPAKRSRPARTAAPDRSRQAAQTGLDRPKQTDAELVQAVREQTIQTGPPTQYQLKQRFGIGSARAARVLEAAGVGAPDGPVSSNGHGQTGGR